MTKTVTVDGPAGTGKSTVSRIFAQRIGYQYIESGLIYRGLTYYLSKSEIGPKDTEKIKEALHKLKIDLQDGFITIDGQKVDEDLRSEKIDKLVALYSCVAEIRSCARTVQHNAVAKNNSVVEGRDIGTAVFPSAFCKFFLDASIDVRAKRRYEEIKQQDPKITLEEVKNKVIERDKVDKKRKISPLTIPYDAFVIDTSELTKEQVVEEMEKSFQKKNLLLDNEHSAKSSVFEKAIDLYESKSYPNGKVLQGKVISVGKEIMIDIGDKTEAYIDEVETEKILRKHTLKKDDELTVTVVSKNDRGIVVSKIRADIDKKRSGLDDDFKNKRPVQGIVKSYIDDKGFNVSLYGVRAFCPLEEYDIRAFNPKSQVGRRSLFEITSFDPKQVLVSRKGILDKKQNENRSSFYSTVKPGDIIKVTAISIKNYGVIVKVSEGVISLLRNKEISWKHVSQEKLPIKVGDSFSVKVTEVDHDAKRFEISKRQAEEDPFTKFIEKHQKNDIIKTKVVHMEGFGAFLEIEPGVEGLLHISDLSWRRNLKHPNEVLKKGDELEVVILRIEPDERRVRLGLKQLQENPWSKVRQNYPLNTPVVAEVTQVTPESLYCLVNGEIEGEVYYKNTPFYKEGASFDFAEKVKVGGQIEAKVLQINNKMHKIELEMRENIEDPWENIKVNFGNGEPLKGVVTEVVEKGVNVKINDDITAFCHISQLDLETPKKIEDAVTIGKEYYFVVQSLNQEKKKLAVSRKDYLTKYHSNSGKKSSNSQDKDTITLSQII